MNEKQAREIIDIAIGCDGQANRKEHGQEMKARGYLEAIEKAKVLAMALDNAYMTIDHHENHVYKEEMEALMKRIEDILAKWEKEK